MDALTLIPEAGPVPVYVSWGSVSVGTFGSTGPPVEFPEHAINAARPTPERTENTIDDRRLLSIPRHLRAACQPPVRANPS